MSYERRMETLVFLAWNAAGCWDTNSNPGPNTEQCSILFSVVFTPPPSSHHGSVWLLPVISLLLGITLYRECGLAYPYDWRGFVGTKKKTSVGLLVLIP